MATRNEHRQQRKAEKQRLKRKAEQKARRTRAVGLAEGDASRAAAWSVGTAWASEGWYEQGAMVRAVFTRRRPDGRSNAAVFEVDLAERGVLSAKVLPDLTDDRLLAEVGRRSEDNAMHEVEPDLVARLVREGRDWGASHGHAQAKGLDDALALMGDVDGSDWPDPIRVGRPGEAAPVAPPTGPPNALARLQRWLFGDPVRPR